MALKTGTCGLLVFTLLGNVTAVVTPPSRHNPRRNQPGDPGFPSRNQWNKLNAEVGGRLVEVVPSAKFCQALPCTQSQWESTVFRSTIPGAMNNYNWEQDYLSNPPSLCIRNGTTCGQGNVPLFAINASSAADIQAGVTFAAKHNLKVAIKSSGHDFLGRSTAKNSLLLWTRNLRNISFTEKFVVGGNDRGSAVTVGSGIPLNVMYTAAKAQSKMIVGGTAATVSAAGGYVQGGGHSLFSPALGLAADNALEFHVVIASGEIVTANDVENPHLYWALRGGGAGSWGVVTSATFRTYPIFNATLHSAQIVVPTNEAVGQLMALHARHIFDWDSLRAGQVYALSSNGAQESILLLGTYFPNRTVEEATAALNPFLDDVRSMNFTVVVGNTTTAIANDLLFIEDGQVELLGNSIVGSRLIPAEAYRINPDGIGKGYKHLLDIGVPGIFGLLVAGGQVADNIKLDNAVNPKWRTAKAHVIVTLGWNDSTPLEQVESIKQMMTTQVVPIFAGMTLEPDSGAYSNEADLREPDFQTTFFGGGTHYQRLLAVKKKYDPNGLFIVGVGVGSEEWDAAGLCRA